MDKFREIGVQTTFDDDDVFDISPTSTLHRGSLTSPTSPGHSSGILARVRNSFSSQKVKDLKRQLRQCEEDILRIKGELQVTNKVHCSLFFLIYFLTSSIEENIAHITQADFATP
jgi:hypothetical protein